MTKADAKRDEITDRLGEFLLAQGLMGASLRPLAASVGTSDRMLLYYFKDKKAVISAALQRIAGRLSGLLLSMTSPEPRTPADLRPDLLELIVSQELRPYMCLWLEVAALAARGDPLLRTLGAQIAADFQILIASRLAFKDPARREATASRLLRVIHGVSVMRSLGISTQAEGG